MLVWMFGDLLGVNVRCWRWATPDLVVGTCQCHAARIRRGPSCHALILHPYRPKMDQPMREQLYIGRVAWVREEAALEQYLILIFFLLHPRPWSRTTVGVILDHEVGAPMRTRKKDELVYIIVSLLPWSHQWCYSQPDVVMLIKYEVHSIWFYLSHAS